VLTLFHDLPRPASAVAVARLERLAAEGLAVAFEALEIVGIDLTLPVTDDVRRELAEVADDAAAEGLALREPPALPPTGLCHVVGAVAERAGAGAAWRTAAYRALWQEGADLADRAVLADLAVDVGLDRPEVETALADRLALAEVRRRTAQLRGEGVGGVPTLLAHRTLVPGLLDEDDLRALAG